MKENSDITMVFEETEDTLLFSLYELEPLEFVAKTIALYSVALKFTDNNVSVADSIERKQEYDDNKKILAKYITHEDAVEFIRMVQMFAEALVNKRMEQ